MSVGCIPFLMIIKPHLADSVDDSVETRTDVQEADSPQHCCISGRDH